MYFNGRKKPRQQGGESRGLVQAAFARFQVESSLIDISKPSYFLSPTTFLDEGHWNSLH
jgi:hypothetical protein